MHGYVDIKGSFVIKTLYTAFIRKYDSDYNYDGEYHWIVRRSCIHRGLCARGSMDARCNNPSLLVLPDSVLLCIKARGKRRCL